MTSRDELDQLSSKELHDRAVSMAERRLDIAWLWRLLKSIPAAEASIGDVDEADENVMSTTALINDFLHADEGDLAEALRPIYLDYLAEHGK